ncbi:hypothetical protein KP509_23G062500 [Ceratopteris richardii]|uniref:Cation/H+ exchanger domain-containing protein n=1 Tax=Ceratopteris richardii TaxID=49495 RepID=A0A8T2S2Z6_CERRI|nr:hypothetical protein KP509_23G062500 [Ceratopteris richardii]
MAPACTHIRGAVSNGVLQGDRPTDFALPLFIIQIVVVLIVTRTLAKLIKPFCQPRVLAEIIGGVLLGPTALGRNKAFLHTIFPKSSMTLLDTVATLGLLFFLFMVGLELDLKEIKKSGKTAVTIAMSGIIVPFMGGVGVSTLIKKAFNLDTPFAPLVVFVGVPVSITAFPVLVRIMAERRILGTELGRLVVPAAAINDVCAWILLAVGVAISGHSNKPATPAYVLACGVAFVTFMLVVVRRFMEWVVRRANGQESVSEIFVLITLVGVLLSAFTTDLIGIHPLFGAFFFGLVVPPEGKFAKILVEKIEDFITILMLPLFFASSGLKTNLGSISGGKGFRILFLLIVTATVGKIATSVAVGLLFKLSIHEAFGLGFLMNTKGLAELIVLNIGLDIGVLDEETFAILVLLCLILMFFTTPGVMAFYKPARNPTSHAHRNLEGSYKNNDEIRVLACVYGTRSIPALLNLVEACRVADNEKQVRLFPLHLTELSERTLSIMNLCRATSEEFILTEITNTDDAVSVAFDAYSRISKVTVKLTSIVSQLEDMHCDVCDVAEEKRSTIIILPYHMYQREDGAFEHVDNPGIKAVNQKVMQQAPCSVCALVDRGPWSFTQLSNTTSLQRIAVIFFGGPDDREALTLGYRLAEHPCMKVWVLRLSPTQWTTIDIDNAAAMELERKYDEKALARVKSAAVDEDMNDSFQGMYYEEYFYEYDAAQVVYNVVCTGEFLLVLVGRQSTGLQSSANSELGVVGETLANAGPEMKSSVLVVQQHDSGSAKRKDQRLISTSSASPNTV